MVVKLSYLALAAGVWFVTSLVVNLQTVFLPTTCSKPPGTDGCIGPLFPPTQRLNIHILVHSHPRSFDRKKHTVAVFHDRPGNEAFEEDISYNVSAAARKGEKSLFVMAVLQPVDQEQYFESRPAKLTTMRQPPRERSLLLDGEDKPQPEEQPQAKVPHLRSVVTLINVPTEVSYPLHAIPAPLHILHGKHFVVQPTIDDFSLLRRDWRPLSEDANRPPVNITLRFRPRAMGHHRFILTLQANLDAIYRMGFTEEDIEDVRGLLSDTNLTMLGLTYLIILLHICFDYLAFKNDIGFWRGRKDLAGLSRRTVIFNCICTWIIFLYLLDAEETSIVVLFSMGVSLAIDMWKVTKVLHIEFGWAGLLPRISMSTKRTKDEVETEQFDATAMHYLALFVAPLVLGWAVYSLVYLPQRSWYSWLLATLANAVYAGGFVLMTPQLFINYKLKSVAHLPWRALMYKAFNTFVDDVFSFIITMPWSHRLACLRDDVVFLVYLYQRWLYPVDLTRVNEFGYAYAEAPENKDRADTIGAAGTEASSAASASPSTKSTAGKSKVE